MLLLLLLLLMLLPVTTAVLLLLLLVVLIDDGTLGAALLAAKRLTADDADVPEEKKARSELEGVSAVTLKRATVFKSPRATSAVDHDELRVRPPRAAGDAAGRAAERAVWQDAVAEQGRRFGLAVAAQADVLVAAEGQLEVVRGQRSRFRVVTREVIRDDPAAADWSRIPVPDQLRRAAGAALGLPTDPGEPAGGLF